MGTKNIILRVRYYLTGNWPLVLIALLPLVILGPLLRPGYILHYDMIFGPHFTINFEAVRNGSALYQSVPISIVLKIVSTIIPMQIVQKLILYAIFFLSAYTMYRTIELPSKFARFTAAVFYCVNPFTYDRLMAGHWLFLLAYSVTPLMLKYFYELYTRPTRRLLIKTIVLWSAIALVSPHHLFILGVLFGAMGLCFIRSKKGLYYALATVFGLLMLSSWWLISIFLTKNFTHDFGIEQFYAYATKTDLNYGIWFNMLSLQGFWYNGWRSVKTIIAWWPLLVLVWALPVFTGLTTMIRSSKNTARLAVALLLASLIALQLAAGPSPDVATVNSWLYQNIPGVSGMREPQKLLSLLALTYAVFTAYGINFLLQKRRRMCAGLLAVLTLTSVVLISLPIFWGTGGQLKPVQYPQSWQNFYSYLKIRHDSSKIIVLPWDMYVDKAFAGSLIANPAQLYFGSQAIISPKVRLSGVTDYHVARYEDINRAVEHQNAQELAAAMRKTGARYVMLMSSSETQNYQWVYNTAMFSVLTEDTSLTILVLTNR